MSAILGVVAGIADRFFALNGGTVSCWDNGRFVVAGDLINLDALRQIKPVEQAYQYI